MEDVTRKRILRKLESLPEAQLYQVLDYIEFIEAKYAALRARKPDAFQQFAERVEDKMRVRSLAPKAVMGTMKIMSTAGRMLDGVRGLGRDLVTPSEPASAPPSDSPPNPSSNRPSHSPPSGASRAPETRPAEEPDRPPPGGANGSG